IRRLSHAGSHSEWWKSTRADHADDPRPPRFIECSTRTHRRVRDDDRDDPDGAGEEHAYPAPAIPRPDPLRSDGGSASDRGAVAGPHRARSRHRKRLTSTFKKKT